MKNLILILIATCSCVFGAQQTINVGTVADDGTGDTLRSAFQKANSNFTELYTADWVVSGTNVYFTGGNVGVNDSTPSYRFDVSGTIGFTTAADARWSRPTTYGLAELLYPRDHKFIPSLTFSGDYVGEVITIGSISSQNLSAVAYSPITGTLFLLRNSGDLYEFTISGTLIRTITLTTMGDCEGVCWMHGDTFALSREGDGSGTDIYIATINSSVTAIAPADCIEINTDIPTYSGGNSGMEGITFDPDSNTFLVCMEKNSNNSAPGRVYRVTMAGVGTEFATLKTNLSAAGALDCSDIFYDRSKKEVYIVGEEANLAFRCSLTSETVLETLSTTNFGQAEGLCFSPDGRFFWMVGEASPNEFGFFVRQDLNAKDITPRAVTLSGKLIGTHTTLVPGDGTTITVVAAAHVLNPAGAITLNGTTAITDGVAGQIVTLIGNHDTNTVTINDAANTNLGGNRVLGAGDTLMLIFNSVSGVWTEIAFANN